MRLLGATTTTLSLLPLLLLVLLQLQTARARITNQEIVTINEALAVAGNMAQLPCDVDPPMPKDKVHLVIWYKEPTDSPLYSFDSRGLTQVEKGKHWQDPSLGNRAFFKYEEAKLNLEHVKESDAGVYRCRVDFKQSPTRNSKVNLTVIIPPESLKILEEEGKAHISQSVLGPYSEGASLSITCVAIGGRPQPRVTWWKGTELLDDSFEVVGPKKVRNVLSIPKLERKHLNQVLTCQASNNNMVLPISSSVTLDMNLRPLVVRLLKSEKRALSANVTYEIHCEVIGAKPRPKIEWTKGGVPLNNAREVESINQNITTSMLTFVPSIDDAGKYLSCRGSVPVIPDSALEDDWKLEIHHKPVITLELGSNLNASAIREGVDVYFECNIRSNPWVYKVAWKHNGDPLFHNVASGTIVSNQSLVLQNVSRNRAGVYSCVGYNQEGDGESNQLSLDIKFAPVCRPGQQNVYGVAKFETIEISCEFEANPRDVSFLWKFNSSMEAIEVNPDLVTSDATRSKLRYTPKSDMDYGTLRCFGSNDRGVATDPCVFLVVPAGPPDPPLNCSVQNSTTQTLHAECRPGFDGGISQQFTLVVESIPSPNALAIRAPSVVVYNLTNTLPSFSVSGLDAGTTYQLTFYSSNAKGRSQQSVVLNGTTLSQPQRRLGEKPVSPENCTIVEESRTSVWVSCAESLDTKNANYIVQVYDAGTRLLLSSAMSVDPTLLKVTNLPVQRSLSGLIIYVRVKSASDFSDATILHSQLLVHDGSNPEQQIFPALSPVILSLSGPLLGIVVGATAGSIIVVFLIIVALKLRYRRRPSDDKDSQHDDGGMATLTAPNDKTATLPLSSDSVESFEKDPDIIPHATDNSYAELCKGTSPRYVLQQQQQQQQQQLQLQQPSTRLEPSSLGSINNKQGLELYETISRQPGKMQYADLTLRINRRVPPNCYQPIPVSSVQRTQLLPMSTLPRRMPSAEPTIYAQVSGHAVKPIYIPPPHPYMGRSSVDDSTAETPLIGCDNKITTITEAANSWRTDTSNASTATSMTASTT